MSSFDAADVFGMLATATFWTAILVVYFLPGINAYWRRSASKDSILFVNLFFGWTLIGWCAALLWSGHGKGERA